MKCEDLWVSVKKLSRAIKCNLKEMEGKGQLNFCEIWPLITEAGFHRLLVGSIFGGRGIALDDYVKAIRLLASIDESIALAIHVHNFAVKIVAELVDVRYQKQIKQQLDEGAMFALARSEYERDYRCNFATKVTVEQLPMVLNGQKDFCTLAGLANYYVVFAQTKEEHCSMDTVQICLVNGKERGIELVPGSGLEAMAATSTYSVRFHQCELDPSGLVGSPGGINGLSNPDTLTLGICAINLGIVDQTLDIFKRKMNKRGAKVGNQEILRWLGQMDVMLSSSELLLEKSIGSRPKHDKESGTWLRRAKASSDLLVNEVTEGAIRYSGIEGIMEKSRLVKLRNNSRAAQVMPPNAYKSMVSLGSLLFER